MNHQTETGPQLREQPGAQKKVGTSSTDTQSATDRAGAGNRILTAEQEIEEAALRNLQQILNEGLAATWERRARQFEEARPKPGDYMGQATPAEIAERDRDLAETARACRLKAVIVRELGDPEIRYSMAVALLDDLAPENRVNQERRAA